MINHAWQCCEAKGIVLPFLVMPISDMRLVLKMLLTPDDYDSVTAVNILFRPVRGAPLCLKLPVNSDKLHTPFPIQLLLNRAVIVCKALSRHPSPSKLLAKKAMNLSLGCIPTIMYILE